MCCRLLWGSVPVISTLIINVFRFYCSVSGAGRNAATFHTWYQARKREEDWRGERTRERKGDRKRKRERKREGSGKPTEEQKNCRGISVNGRQCKCDG